MLIKRKNTKKSCVTIIFMFIYLKKFSFAKSSDCGLLASLQEFLNALGCVLLDEFGVDNPKSILQD